MTLFNDTDLFYCGTSNEKKWDYPDCELLLVDHFISKQDADNYYTSLLEHTNWKQYEMELFHKKVTAPRMIAWYQDTPSAAVWPHDLQAIREKVQQQVGENFNAVLLNLYRDGQDSVAWHTDKEDTTGANPTIASVTFGETRLFRLRHKFRKDLPIIEIPLHHGSFLLMSGPTNSYWQHQVPKTTRKVLPRINLTFRQVKTNQ